MGGGGGNKDRTLETCGNQAGSYILWEVSTNVSTNILVDISVLDPYIYAR